jgi:hypothetical protein
MVWRSDRSTVYVEAELTMKEQPAGEDGLKKPAQPFLLHREPPPIFLDRLCYVG